MTNQTDKARRSSLALALPAALLLLSYSLYAQTPAPGSTVQPSGARIKKTIRLVEVDVIAKDKKGRPIADLDVRDFTLKDDGRVEKIALFSIQQQDGPAEVKSIDNLEKTPSPPSPIQSFSNNHPSSPVPVVILIDMLNTSWDNQPAMKSALLASLKRIASHTPIALLILGDELRVESDFTTDTNSLATLLVKAATPKPEGSGPAITALTSPNHRFNEVILNSAIRAFNQEAGDRVDRTLRSLNLIRDQLTRMRGRKSLIWIGGGLSVTPRDWPVVHRVIDQFNDSNVAVYTVDARGVVLDYGVGADIDGQDMLGPWSEEQAETRGDVLEVIARGTGGVPYSNTNALDRAVARAVDDNNTVYTLGYYPQHDNWQGQAHKLEVKVGRPGVTLRYRSGYLATPEARPEPPSQTLDAIAASPLDFPGLRFSVEVQSGKDPATETLTLHVPASELRLSSQDEKLAGALQLWFIQRQPSGEDLTRKTSTFSFQLSAAEYDAIVSHGLTLASVIKLNQATAKVRVLLRDNNSGRVGTVDVPVNSATKLTPGQ